MKRTILLSTISATTLFATASLRAQTTEPFTPGKVQTTPIPPEFKDPETGLRIIHLSRFPTDYGSVIYFTYNTFSPDSNLTLVNAQFKDKWRYLYTFDLSAMTVKPLVTDKLTQSQVVAPKTGNVYYLADNAAWVVPLAGGEPRKIADIPARWCPGVGFTVNADETLLLGGSIAMAGLIQEQTKQAVNGLPGVDQIPILGQLFRSQDFINNQTELMVIVTPYVVRAVAQKELARPDDGFAPASDSQSALLARINRVYGLAARVGPVGAYQGNFGFIID